jgi:hypothetical protein
MSIRIDGTNTTANPGITGGDVDTGLQFGTDEVSIVTGGTDRVTVDSSGNVDIGSGNIALNANGSLIGSNVVGTEVPTNDIGLFVNNSVASVTNFIVNGDGTTKIGLGAGNQYGIVLKPREASNKPYLLVQDTETANSPNVAISAAGSAAYYDGTAYKWQLNADGSATFAGKITTNVNSGTYLEQYYNGTKVVQWDADGTLRIGGTLPASPGIRLRPDGSQTNTSSYGVGRTGGTGSDYAFVSQWNSSTTSYITAGGAIHAITTTIQPVASERRLKENISLIDSSKAWETIKTTPFYSYNFIGVDSVNYGPIADEVPDEMRVATDRSDDVGTIHTYDNGMLQARLYTALQTALTRIEALEAEVTALKGAAS